MAKGKKQEIGREPWIAAFASCHRGTTTRGLTGLGADEKAGFLTPPFLRSDERTGIERIL